jgi:hypothetical protein
MSSSEFKSTPEVAEAAGEGAVLIDLEAQVHEHLLPEKRERERRRERGEREREGERGGKRM